MFEEHIQKRPNLKPYMIIIKILIQNTKLFCTNNFHKYWIHTTQLHKARPTFGPIGIGSAADPKARPKDSDHSDPKRLGGPPSPRSREAHVERSKGQKLWSGESICYVGHLIRIFILLFVQLVLQVLQTIIEKGSTVLQTRRINFVKHEKTN